MEKFDEETLSSWVKNPDNIEQYNSTYELSVSNPEKFWKNHCEGKPNGDQYFSKEVKNLLEGMLALDPE